MHAPLLPALLPLRTKISPLHAPALFLGLPPSLCTALEEVEVVLGLQRLFGPRVLIAFPPPGFVFHKGVGPFWKINIEEDEKKLKVSTPSARAHSHVQTHTHTHTCSRWSQNQDTPW